MADPDPSGLEKRVARLERAVEALLAGTEGAVEAPASEAPGADEARRPDASPPHGRDPADRPDREREPPLEPPPTRPTPAPSEPFLAMEGEKWLARVGVGFVVLAFAFLLKLSFDRGWVTPALRLGTGFVTGVGLIAMGVRLERERSRLAQAMIGGGVALLYLVGFAGFQLYELLPVWAALSLMTTTTVLALVISERQDSPALSIIGVLGGLATPFLLELTRAHQTSMALYASLVILGAAPVQFLRGWTGLLVALALGGAATVGGLGVASYSLSPFWPFLALVALFWATTVASPTLRPLLRPGVDEGGELWVARAAAGWGTAVTALVVIGHVDLSQTAAGVLVLWLGLLCAGLAVFARYEPRASTPAAEVGALAVAVGLSMIAWSSMGIFLVMAEVCVLLLLATRGAPPSLASLGHGLALAAGVAFLMVTSRAEPGASAGLFLDGGVVRLGVLALLLVAALWTEEQARVYRGVAYVGLLLWLLSELWYRPNGQAWVSIAWALQGTIALVASIPRDSQALQLGGLATLGLVAGKLLLVDLAQLDPVLRILLFLGFGATLLVLGYLINRRRSGEAA